MTEGENSEQLRTRISMGCESCGIRLSNYDDDGHLIYRAGITVVVISANDSWSIPYCHQCADKLFPHRKVKEKVGACLEFCEIESEE